MIAALQALRAQKIRNLIERNDSASNESFCLAVAAGIDDPQRRTAFAVASRASSASTNPAPIEVDRVSQRNLATALS